MRNACGDAALRERRQAGIFKTGSGEGSEAGPGAQKQQQQEESLALPRRKLCIASVSLHNASSSSAALGCMSKMSQTSTRFQAEGESTWQFGAGTALVSLPQHRSGCRSVARSVDPVTAALSDGREFSGGSATGQAVDGSGSGIVLPRGLLAAPPPGK